MILLIFTLYCIVGSFSAGVAFSLNEEVKIDPVGVILMTFFAPVTLLYIVSFLSMSAGQALVKSIKR